MSTPEPPRYKQNRLKQLRAFCTAARHGSISKAADALFLSQPSISLQVQALERELGLALFQRNGPRIALTPDGKAVYDMAAPLVEGIDRLPETIDARLRDLNHGVLNIAAGESTILYILPPFVRAFSNAYPQVKLALHNVTGRDGLSRLRADEADFAVGSMLDVDDDLEYHPIFNFAPVLITAEDHPLAGLDEVTLEDIGPYGLILPPRELSTWRMVDLAFRSERVDYRVQLEVGGWEVIKTYVALGLGVSIVTSVCLVGNEPLSVKPLDRYFPHRSYGIVRRRGRFLSEAARRFIAQMDAKYAETLHQAGH
ncbi:MAG: LysR family transcriptional regulator [Pseudomonadota bacterium]